LWIQERQKIEVQGMEDGFYGVWFPTTILKTILEEMFG
jgi:hypothetical protein